MVYFTFASSAPSGVMVASTFTRCVEEKGSSPVIVFQQLPPVQLVPQLEGFFAAKIRPDHSQGATSRLGSRYIVRLPSSVATSAFEKSDGRGSCFSGASAVDTKQGLGGFSARRECGVERNFVFWRPESGRENLGVAALSEATEVEEKVDCSNLRRHEIVVSSFRARLIVRWALHCGCGL